MRDGAQRFLQLVGCGDDGVLYQLEGHTASSNRRLAVYLQYAQVLDYAIAGFGINVQTLAKAARAAFSALIVSSLASSAPITPALRSHFLYVDPTTCR
jgi:hypothetical protein